MEIWAVDCCALVNSSYFAITDSLTSFVHASKIKFSINLIHNRLPHSSWFSQFLAVSLKFTRFLALVLRLYYNFSCNGIRAQALEWASSHWMFRTQKLIVILIHYLWFLFHFILSRFLFISTFQTSLKNLIFKTKQPWLFNVHTLFRRGLPGWL